jgi:hypothetical protein
MSFGDRFLQYPDLFPARRSGEPWGDREVVLGLPGGPYRFSGLDRSQEREIKERMGDFLVEKASADNATHTRVYRAASSDFIDFQKRGWEYTLDVDCQPSYVRLAGLDFLGRLDWSPYLGGGLWTPVHEKERFRGAFENFARVLSSYRFLERGGALIHSAGVLQDGGAFIFVGRSGSGKTTLSRLSLESGRRVLSDDLNAVQPSEHGPFAQKIPFAGELGPTSTELDAYPLRAICRIEKGENNLLRPMGRAEAVATLTTCTPNVNQNRHWQDRLLRVHESLIQSVPTFVLTFSRKDDFWDVLEKSI